MGIGRHFRKNTVHHFGPFRRKGQALLEFILLFALIIGLSFGLLVLVNGHLAKRWTVIVNKIVGPAAQPRQDLRVKLR